MFRKHLCTVAIVASTAIGSGFGVSADPVTATRDERTGEVVLANDGLRLRFHAPGPRRFGLFPKGYTGYAVELKTGDVWGTVATTPYFTAFCYRSGWGRDWLAYVIPQTVHVERHGDSASVTFSETKWDADRVKWDFTFVFRMAPANPWVDVVFSAVADARRELLQMWGPRLHAGQGAFGAARDEALFPGLEFLGAQGRSSGNPALAPDARFAFAPTPAKITIPLMAVLHGKQMVGLLWDPLQKWLGDEICPSAVFASPNWIEGGENHLMGLFVPSIPRYVAENSMRAHTPVVVEAGRRVSVSARIFAVPAAHVVEAVDVYLKHRGGLPARPAIDAAAVLETLARAMTTTAYDETAKGWPSEFRGNPAKGPWPDPAIHLAEAAPLLGDRQLGERAARISREVLERRLTHPLSLALRMGGLADALRNEQATAQKRMKAQNADGSWSYVPTEVAEGGLAALSAPPEPGEIAPAGTKNQGITAGELAPLLDYALITGDAQAWQASLRGLADLDRYSIPYAQQQPECPPSPSLHGSCFALRCNLTAYRITGERRYLERAVYWAKTGLPFLYLWSLPAKRVVSGQIHCAEKINLPGETLYDDPRRDVMLYGGLYGYGSSQFSHHWFGILVQWIPLVYARDISALAEYDRSLPWKRLAEGIVASAVTQSFEKPPYTGFLPDAFSLDSWTPSGPAISPATVLDAILRHYYGQSVRPQTEVVRAGDARCHITSAQMPTRVTLMGNSLRATLTSRCWSRIRAVITGVGDHPDVLVDGRRVPRVDELEAQEECWTPGPAGTVLLKIRQGASPRSIEVRF